MCSLDFKMRPFTLLTMLLISVCVVPLCSNASTPADGVLSPYIVGTYDNIRDSLSTVIQVINPTANTLEIVAFFLDDNERILRCVREKLSANDMVELWIARLELKAEVGVVKIVSFKPGTKTPLEGIVGYKRTFILRRLVTETVLHSIPSTALRTDLPRLLKSCQ